MSFVSIPHDAGTVTIGGKTVNIGDVTSKVDEINLHPIRANTVTIGGTTSTVRIRGDIYINDVKLDPILICDFHSWRKGRLMRYLHRIAHFPTVISTLVLQYL